MNRMAIFFVILFLVTSNCYSGLCQSTVSSSDKTNPAKEQKILKNTLFLNVLSPLVRTLNLGYERALNQKFSAQIAFLKGSIYPQGISAADTNYFNQTGITGALKYYLRSYPGKTVEDFFLGPYLRYLDMEMQDFAFGDSGFEKDSLGRLKLNQSKGSSWKIGVQAGSRQIFFKRLAIEVFSGIHYQYSTGIRPVSSETINLISQQGIGFRMGITAGFCF